MVLFERYFIFDNKFANLNTSAGNRSASELSNPELRLRGHLLHREMVSAIALKIHKHRG